MNITIKNDGTWSYADTDIDGNPVRRSMHEYKYSYDPFVIWKGDYTKGSSETVYSDRLWQWDCPKYEQCYLKTFGRSGQDFYNKKPEDIEKFLSLYFDKEIKLTGIEQGCNYSDGNVYWVFYFESK